MNLHGYNSPHILWVPALTCIVSAFQITQHSNSASYNSCNCACNIDDSTVEEEEALPATKCLRAPFEISFAAHPSGSRVHLPLGPLPPSSHSPSPGLAVSDNANASGTCSSHDSFCTVRPLFLELVLSARRAGQLALGNKRQIAVPFLRAAMSSRKRARRGDWVQPRV